MRRIVAGLVLAGSLVMATPTAHAAEGKPIPHAIRAQFRADGIKLGGCRIFYGDTTVIRCKDGRVFTS